MKSTLKFCIVVLFVFLPIFVVVMQVNAAQGTLKTKNSLLVLEKTEYGNVGVKRTDAEYYYLKTRIKAKSQADFSFKKESCTLVDSSGKRNSECWISITGGSAGLSFSQSAPISMKNFEAIIGEKTVNLSALMIDGPAGSLDFKLPKDGYVDIFFLWPVAKGFKPEKGVLSGLADIKFLKH